MKHAFISLIITTGLFYSPGNATAMESIEKRQESIPGQQPKTLVSDKQENCMNGFPYQTYYYHTEIAFSEDFNSAGKGKITFKNTDTGESFSLTGVTLKNKKIISKEELTTMSLLILAEGGSTKNMDIFAATFNAYLSGKRRILSIKGYLDTSLSPVITISVKSLEDQETIYYIDASSSEQMEAFKNL